MRWRWDKELKDATFQVKGGGEQKEDIWGYVKGCSVHRILRWDKVTRIFFLIYILFNILPPTLYLDI